MALHYACEMGSDECERLLGKPYRRLLDHLARMEKTGTNGHDDLTPETALDPEPEPGDDWHACIDPTEHRFFYYPGKIEGPVTGNIYVTIEMDERERELLGKPVHGQGGFQTLLRHLQKHCLKDEGKTLVMVKRTAYKAVKTARHNRGDGGFQGRLARVAELAAAQLGTYRPVSSPEEAAAEIGAVLPAEEGGP
jgi:hypothetical protein